MNLNRVLVFCEQQSQNAAFCKEGFVFTCLTYWSIKHLSVHECFWNGPVYILELWLEKVHK